ncbi:MAG: hypothetical protein JKY08_11555 [Flavobacteriaceae bacterium]|nr:hypothetical protein [Flavobacteriaceae bacterium]
MHNRSDEINNLLNPAFCGAVYVAMVDGYNSKSESNIPIYLPYVLMPIILHKDSRNTIPSTAITKFHSWIQSKEQVKIGLHKRVKSLEPFISEAMLFLSGQGLLMIDDLGAIELTSKTKINKIIKNSESISEYIRKAKTLGTICGNTHSDSTILALLGLQI